MRLSEIQILRNSWTKILLLMIGMVVLNHPVMAQDFKPAKAAIESKDYNTAISQLRTILADKPKSHEAHYLLGVALKATGQADEALAEFQESARRKKSYTNAWYELGLLQINKGLLEEATKSLVEGEKRSKGKEPRFFYAMGLLEAKKGNDNEAKVLMAKAQAAEPENPIYVRGLGDVYKEKKVWQSAINQYRRALAMAPNSPDAANTHYEIGQMNFQMRKFNDAVMAFKKATDLDPTMADAWYQQGFILSIAKQYVNAEEPLRKSVELQPDHFESNFYLAEALHETKRIQMAIPFYEKAIAANANHEKAVLAYPSLAEGLIAAGDYDKAVNAYRVAVEQKPDDFELVYGLGWAQAQADVGEYDAGILNLKKAIDLDPTSEKPHIQLAITYFDLERHVEAIPHLRKAIELNPEDQNPYAYLGRAYIKQGQYDEAVSSVKGSLNPVLASHSDASVKNRLSNVYFTLGQELYKEKQYMAAISMFQEKVAIDSTSIPTYQNMGVAALLSQDYELSRDVFQRVIILAEAKDDTAVVIQSKGYLASSYLQLKDFRSAGPVLNDIVTLDPQNANAFYQKGYIFVVRKQYAGAIPDLKKAVALKPDNASYHLLLAQCHLNAQQFNSAAREYREVLKLDAQNKVAREQLQIAIDAANQAK